eukprot:gene10605-12275_t
MLASKGPVIPDGNPTCVNRPKFFVTPASTEFNYSGPLRTLTLSSKRKSVESGFESKQHDDIGKHLTRSVLEVFKERMQSRCLPTSQAKSEEPADELKSSSTSSISDAEPPVDPLAVKKKLRKADSTDPIATFLSRRFGIAGGLAWLGFLAIGSIGEQVKTRMEFASEEAGKKDVTDTQEVVLPNGLRYTDLRIGGGQLPQQGYLAVLHFIAKADGVVFEDTYERNKPIILRFGGRPFVAGLCEGAELAISTMKIVPPELGFGEKGGSVRPTLHASDKAGIIPPNATLEYTLDLIRISIPPS